MTAQILDGKLAAAEIKAELAARLAEAIDALNADPACTGYIVPLPRHLDENATLAGVDPGGTTA